MSRSLILITGDQLSLDLGLLQTAGDNDVVVLCEVAEEGRYVPHHPQKIAMMLSAMRHFAATLRDKGYRVHYSALDDPATPMACWPKRNASRMPTTVRGLSPPGPANGGC